MKKKKIATISIMVATVILAGIAVFTASRLYKLRQESISPAAPESKPAAAAPQLESCGLLTFTLPTGPICYEGCTDTSECPTGLECQDVGGQNICVDTECPEDADCSCGTTTYECNSDCTEDSQCQTVDASYVCDTTSDKCRLDDNLTSTTCEGTTTTYECNSTCTADSQCQTANSSYVCDSTSSRCRLDDNLTSTTCEGTSTATPTATPSDEPELPDAGVSFPTLLSAGAGILIIVFSLLLVF